jgi:predicted Rossmann-fold nucleotide-binding protein
VDHGRKTKDPIGVVFEKRKTERAANYYDLLRLARRLFAADTADAVHIVIDVSEVRRAIHPEVARDCPMG